MAKLTDIGKIVENAVKSKGVLEAVGKSATRQIVRRTRVGKTVDENFSESKPLPKLEPKTTAVRKSLKRSGRLTGKGATPAKSAVNRSGALLESVDYTAFKGGLVINVGKDQEKKLKELVKINSSYNFMNLSKAEFNRAIKAATGKITGILNRINFNKL